MNTLAAFQPAPMRQRLSARPVVMFPVLGTVYGLVLLYCAAWPVTRGWGGSVLAVVLALCLPFVNRAFLRQLWPFVALAALYLLYAVLSTLGLFETGWTRLFDPGAITQQVVSYPALLVLVCLFHRVSYGSGLMAGDNAVLTALGLKLVMAAVSAWSGEAGFLAALFNVENLTNQHAIPLLLFFYWSMVARPSVGWTVLGGVYVIACAGTTSAALLGVFAILFGVLACRGRTAVLIVASLAIFSVLAPLFPLQLLSLDANSGVRAFFWRDGLELAAQSHFIGIGLGTELVRNYYPSLPFDWRLVDDGSGQLIFIGLHSSFYQALVRVGMAGLLLLGLGCWRLCALARQNARPALAWMALCTLLTSLTVNPSLDSANFMFANALMIAWLLGPVPANAKAQRA